MNIDERKNVPNTSNTGSSQFIKDHGCGCGVLAAVMVVLTIVLLVVFAPYMPINDEGAKYDPGFILTLYIGAFLVIGQIYGFISKLIRCKSTVTARMIVLTGDEIRNSPISIYPPNENYEKLESLCVYEYDFEGTTYRVKRERRKSDNTSGISEEVNIRVNPQKPTDYFYWKENLIIAIILLVVGALIAAPSTYLKCKSISTALLLA